MPPLDQSDRASSIDSAFVLLLSLGGPSVRVKRWSNVMWQQTALQVKTAVRLLEEKQKKKKRKMLQAEETEDLKVSCILGLSALRLQVNQIRLSFYC